MGAHAMLAVPAVLALLQFVSTADPQFIDTFDASLHPGDPPGVPGWTFLSGNGSASMDFVLSGRDHATISVDARQDRRNVWWALIKRRVSDRMDLRLPCPDDYAVWTSQNQ